MGLCERRTLPQMPVIRRNKSEGKATGPRPELLTLGLACNTPDPPEEALEIQSARARSTCA